MTPHPRLTRASLDLVKRFEGFRPRAARLSGGGWMIGYGHTASAREGAVVDAAGAEALLTYDLDRIARAVDLLVFAPLNANQFNALAAFAFNVGVEAFAASEVLRRVNAGEVLEAALALEAWRQADVGGERRTIDALVRRRAAEKLLFLTPPEGFPLAPTPLLRPLCAGAAGPDEARPHPEPEPPPVTAAARRLSERVEALFDEPPAPPSLSDDDVAAPEVEASEAAPDAVAPDLPPTPFAEEAEPPPLPTGEAAPPAEPAPASRLRRPSLPVEAPTTEAAPAPARDGRSLGLRVLGVRILGGAGLAAFLGALLAMAAGKAAPLTLGVGLAGLVGMAPAAHALLMRLFDGGEAG